MTIATGATGAQKSLAFVAESVFGTTPTTPSMKLLRAKIGTKFDLKRDTFTSKEMRADRQVGGLTYGNRSGSGEIPFELSYGSFDELIEALMGGTWNSNILKIGNVKRSFTFEERWDDINYTEINAGTVLTAMSLSVKPNAIVEGSFTVMFKDQTSAQYADDGTTTNAFAATTITRSAGSFVTDGFAIGDLITISGASTAANNRGISAPVTLTGVAATVLTATAAAFTVDTAKTGVTITKVLGAPTAVNANAVFDAFTGSAQVDGATAAIITGIDLKVEQAANASNVLFDPTIQQVTLGTVSVTGTMVMRFINKGLKAKFLAGSTADLMFKLGGASKAYQFDMSTVYITAADDSNDENELTMSYPFQATYNTGDASSLIITRTP